MNLPITPNKSNTSTIGGCGNCSSKETFLLHHVRVRGVHRRLCTSCVLRAHPSSFCPCCFTFYDTSPPPPSKRISCSNCTSFTHSHCATSSPPFPFLCPPCADANFNFFNFENINKKTIDKDMATVLLCAAKIAANSMAKAVNVARTEAERRVREAAVCRKRAREALEHVLFLAKRKDADSVQVSASAHLGKRVINNITIGSPQNANSAKTNGNGNHASNASNAEKIKENS
ncbi:uncharacterized protein LOC8274959 [Ricinus communis]|uniref:DNA binding protein, putative n=1 Tax=Ricinus communis TaxID=3988 RepID=B9RFQ8_RICCO|nr:uncharacterized protein LOC8274959 [Ricinus communis]EEF50029.1 DNA binding protein, putative [Ricinus communis]|eukprot:XP_015570582.1 uncharacterized protein LOC8274959 [Ricinus communis]